MFGNQQSKSAIGGLPIVEQGLLIAEVQNHRRVRSEISMPETLGVLPTFQYHKSPAFLSLRR